MEEITMKVLLVDRDDYVHHIQTVWGLPDHVIDSPDLIIDRDTGKILKSRHF